MTDNKGNDKPRLTLKLNPEKVGIAPSSGSNEVIKKNISGAKTITVEVKKKRGLGKKDETQEQDNKKAILSDLNLTESELSLRMKVVQQAAHDEQKRREQQVEQEKENQKIIKSSEQESELETKSTSTVMEENKAQPKAVANKEEEKPKSGVSPKLPLVEIRSPNFEEEELKVKAKEEKAREKVEVKEKYTEIKGLRGNKLDVRFISDEEDEEQPVRKRSLSSIRRAREKARRHEIQANQKQTEKIVREVTVPELITVQELSSRMAEKSSDVIRELMKLGMMVTINQSIDADTAELIIDTFGHKIKRVQESDVENVLTDVPDDVNTMEKRAPVVTVMGHVDHGKTSLLDALRSSDIVSGEAGGITQHIGAHLVHVNEKDSITFLDTPGHEAFSAMRSRGAKVTDIVVLVVAADDGIMAQTVEAINHAKAAEVPIIIAVNKIDKPEADPYRVRNELLSHGLVVEDLGGDIMAVDVSAKQKLNLDKLIDAILLQAEMMELKSNYNRLASGTVIESKVDKGRGVVTSLLVQKGTLKMGDILVAGATSGKVRGIINDKGKHIDIATPSMPIEVVGLSEAPMAGDLFNVVTNEKQAREITGYRARKLRELKNNIMNRTTTLHEIFARAPSEGIKELPIIVKGDVHGSVEAIAGSLQKIVSNEVRVKILHSAVGGITESDVTLAKASNAIILGFNVRANATARQMAEVDGIDIRYYSIIYNLIDDVKLLVSGMLSPILREEYIGNAEIRQVFNTSKYGKIAGCYVTRGMIKRGAGVRLIRDNIVIHEGKLKTLKRFKDDVKEVKEGFECGVAFENYDDIREKDTLEAFEIIEEKQILQ
ncbi:MAG: translation initiation factor IF-2 [Sphingobacteriia bacterium]|nr:translation initiation factor IF-2 [Sphingobacteriia bacterium]